jgi:hypothetical protein
MITIEITEKEAQLILAGLGELPAKMCIDFILKFKQTCEKQIVENQKSEETN